MVYSSQKLHSPQIMLKLLMLISAFAVFFMLGVNGGGMVSKGLRAFNKSSYSKFWSGLLRPENH
jgi:hypothetical protein